MLKQVYKINVNGYLQEILVKDFDKDGNCMEELAENIITTPPPDGLIRIFETARWTGEAWVSSMSEEEYIATLPNAEMAPNIEDRLKSAEDTILFLLMGGV